MGQRKAFRRTIKEPDEFIGIAEQVRELVRNNPTRVWSTVAGVLALLVFAWGVSQFSDYRREAAVKAYGEAMLAYEQALRDPTGVSKAVEKLEKVHADQPDSAEGRTALFFAANLHFQNGNQARAGDLYGKVAKESGASPTLSLLAGRNAACVREALGDAAGAEKLLQAELAAASGLPKGEVLLDLARLAAKRGGKDKAEEYYRQLLEFSPEGAYGNLARRKLGMPARKAKSV